MIGELYKLTSEGRKVAGSISPSRRDDMLDFLYRQKSGATVEELCNVTGMSKGALRATLAKYRSKGFVKSTERGDL